jgi:lipopolysaccharide transport system permease protein
MSCLTDPIILLWKNRSLLYQTTLNDIRARFAGSILGLAWLALYPLLFLAAYSIVVIFIYGSRLPSLSRGDSVAFIFCGLIPFLGLAEALSLGTSSVTSNVNLIKNTLFPIDLIPVKAVLVSQSSNAISIGILLLFLGLLGRFSVSWLLLAPILILQLMFSIGITWVLASLNVFIRDLQSIISVVIMILMMVSPIGWTDEMVPRSLLPFMKLNPLYYFISSYKTVLFNGAAPRSDILIVLSLMGFAALSIGYWFFSKMKKVFSDNV